MLRPLATLLVTTLLVACQSPVLESTPPVVGVAPSIAEATRSEAGPSIVEAVHKPGPTATSVAAPSAVEAAPLEATPTVLKKRMLVDHGLYDDAQRELIEVMFSAADASEKARALNLLATVAVLKSNFNAALDTWNRLIDEYPTSAEATKARELLPLLTRVIGQLAEELVDDVAAPIYLRSADFWSEERDRKFTIATSWIPNVAAAVHWYDKVITEIPGSSAARGAYEDKMRTILGWKDPGQSGQSHGIIENASYLPQLVSTFRAYEAEFPTATRAQGFRF